MSFLSIFGCIAYWYINMLSCSETPTKNLLQAFQLTKMWMRWPQVRMTKYLSGTPWHASYHYHCQIECKVIPSNLYFLEWGLHVRHHHELMVPRKPDLNRIENLWCISCNWHMCYCMDMLKKGIHRPRAYIKAKYTGNSGSRYSLNSGMLKLRKSRT